MFHAELKVLYHVTEAVMELHPSYCSVPLLYTNLVVILDLDANNATTTNDSVANVIGPHQFQRLPPIPVSVEQRILYEAKKQRYAKLLKMDANTQLIAQHVSDFVVSFALHVASMYGRAICS